MGEQEVDDHLLAGDHLGDEFGLVAVTGVVLGLVFVHEGFGLVEVEVSDCADQKARVVLHDDSREGMARHQPGNPADLVQELGSCSATRVPAGHDSDQIGRPATLWGLSRSSRALVTLGTVVQVGLPPAERAL